MPGFRFLVRTNATFGHTLSVARTSVGPLGLRLTPLFPYSSKSLAFGLSGDQDWFIAQTAAELDPASVWDECHSRLASGHDFAADGAAIYAEPDWPQRWLPVGRTELVSPFGVVSTCAEEQRWIDNHRLPHGDKPDWHLEDTYSGLRSARNRVRIDGRRVRVGHLDTGYDAGHKLLPAQLRHDLECNFVDNENPHSAADPFVSGILKNPGHGTGTIGILAGSKLEGLDFPDEDTRDYLGGCYFADVIPVRIATSVVLFYTSALARGLDYLTAPRGDSSSQVDVVTISMGGLASGAWTEIVNRAYELGICIFAAAGNNFGGFPTHHIVYPARYNRVTAVCGVMADGSPYYDLGLNTMAGNYGPGSKMATAVAAFTPNIPWPKWGCPNAYRWDGEGTSAATPQAAAGAALYIQHNLPAVTSYSEGWMRVEAVRKALFDSAKKNTRDDWHSYFGNGILNAAAALEVQPAEGHTLRKQEPDSASFPFLRVITGWGIAPATSEMMQLEVVQLTQQSQTLQEIIPDPHLPPDQITDQQRKQFFEAILALPSASNTLKNTLRSQLGKLVVQVPGSAPPEGPKGATAIHEANQTAVLTTVHADPVYRKLRGYVTDPSLSTELQNVGVSQTLYRIPWEPNLQPGPKGEYIEVVDIDYSENITYPPVDLNERDILAQDGLAPSEGNAQFHQQMVYTIAMCTICHFEAALGRRAMWADDNGNYVRRLKLHPHAMRDENAFYSPDRKAILFGYFNAENKDPAAQYPGGMVYTCLSHDIVAHEVTHALLDGMHKGFREPTNPDVLAFHEAFADIVAVFQQFAEPEMVKSQLSIARGDLQMETLLGNLARQFGKATTGHAALRSAYLKLLPKGSDVLEPDPTAYRKTDEPHERGAVLLAAVFGAFLAIYRSRTADLMRIATSGSGVLPLGALHPDLVNRLCDEASKAAVHVLRMCIRALDYCPPFDISFGDFLRAIITADYDTTPDDTLHYRVAFVESFRKWGICPPDLPTLSIETLLWRAPQINSSLALKPVFDFLSGFVTQNRYAATRKNLFLQTEKCKEQFREELDRILKDPTIAASLSNALGLDPDIDYAITRLRFSQKISPDGDLNPQIIAAVTQEKPLDGSIVPFRGGSTLVADLRRSVIRYCITKNINSIGRRSRQITFTRQLAETAQYLPREPFAPLHATRNRTQ